MSQSSIKDMLRVLGLVAGGTFLLFITRDLLFYGLPGFILAYVSWLGGESLIGAGVLSPFGKPWLGAGIGVVASFVWLALPF